MSGNDINIQLIPKVYDEMMRVKYTRGYNNKVDNIISDIADKFELSKDIESTRGEKKRYLQINQSYFNFIRMMLRDAISSNANYFFFIDKTNKLKF